MKVFTAKVVLTLLSMIGHSMALKVTNITTNTVTNQTDSQKFKTDLPLDMNLRGVVDPLYAQHENDRQAFINKNGNDPS